MPVSMTGSPTGKTSPPGRKSPKKDSRYSTGPILADVGSGGGWSGTKATKAGDAVQDKRSSFDRNFDDEQAKWQNNEDRNDDALYHRSFDDGSMHLVSTKFRDGKPVDNHGKEIGGMGAAPVTKYRRHDTQSAVSQGETATFVPLEEDNATLRYFAATTMKDHERGWTGLKGAAPWDNSPFRPVPYEVRGLKTVTNEPWVEDVKANPETTYATSSFSRLDDGQNDSAALLFQRRLEENQKIAANRGLMPWHDSPVLWRFPSGQAGRSIEYGETAATLKNEYQYTSHIQNGANMNLDTNIGSTHLLR